MTDIVLRDADPVLMDRIGRVAEARGWPLAQALLFLLEHGLFVYESEYAARFDSSENDVLQAAIAALEQVPDDAGFAAIGRVPASPD